MASCPSTVSGFMTGRNTEFGTVAMLARAMHDGAPVQRADLTGSGRADLVQIDQRA
jgi:hypothetical protein